MRVEVHLWLCVDIEMISQGWQTNQVGSRAVGWSCRPTNRARPTNHAIRSSVNHSSTTTQSPQPLLPAQPHHQHNHHRPATRPQSQHHISPPPSYQPQCAAHGTCAIVLWAFPCVLDIGCQSVCHRSTVRCGCSQSCDPACTAPRHTSWGTCSV